MILLLLKKIKTLYSIRNVILFKMSFTEQLLQHPFSMIVAGPSKAGKTVFTLKLLENIDVLSTEPPSEIIWCYSEYQPNYQYLARNNPHIKFIKGLPDVKELRESSTTVKLMVLDDLMTESSNSKDMTKLFTRGVHHWGISVVHIVQNLFFGGLRTARINTNYLVLFKNPSDNLQVMNLARQLYPKKSDFFVEAYRDATTKAFSYLFVDLSQSCPDRLRLRTGIFPDETTMVYT